MITAILGSIAGKLAGFAATQALDAISGNSKDDMEQMRKDLSTIVKDANIEQDIYNQEFTINTMIKFINIDYKHAKEDGKNKEDLYYLLNDATVAVYSSLRKSCDALSTEETKRKGISTYITATNVFFSVIQEMAKQDPDVTDYTKSRHIKDLVDYANIAIIHASDVVDLIRKERCAYVSEVEAHSAWSTVSACTYYDFNDNYVHQHSLLYAYHQGLDEDQVVKERIDYIQSLRDQLNWIDNVIENWRIMLNIPPCSYYNPDLKNIIRGPDFSDNAGWDQPQYYKTLQFADIDGDGQAEMIIRSSLGLIARKYEASSGLWIWLPDIPELSDKNGWDQPQYYETIQCADIDSDGKAEMIARDAFGIYICKYDPSKREWTRSRGPDFGDKDGWDQPQYYKTLQFADIDGDGKAEMIIRSAFGLIARRYEASSGLWVWLTDGPQYSDNAGWDQPQYYKTLQFADINGDGQAELIVRDASCIRAWKYDHSTGQWTQLSNDPKLSDKSVLAHWDCPQYYETIQCADIDGDHRAELIGRDKVGIFTYKV